ncbi:type VI secretion system baseplate subunit TssG [Aquisalimonas lutea]|uniref:type VI secretion system baseplate subunit TssG n=1 Tax=Aquisalimonas lutea TaxID=1327750 RepID=UPI0025B4048E|nr:type VI secretion system baseplate subunit TssG [Aquisalimonas lutea]MDN3519575.1 type VI secretion system baseplate subunit TssG [Aquisalimonas lutea]
MATAQRQSTPDLSAAFGGPGHRCDDFYQLVRALERRLELAQGRHETAPVGGDGPPSREPVRFRGSNEAAFPARAVESLRPRKADRGPEHEMRVNFLGLTGPTGALPAHYNVVVRQRLKERDTALADFLDLFNHRLVALYYRAWSKHRLPIQYERTDSRERDSFTRAVDAFSGQPAGRRDEPRRYYAGHFARQTRSPSGMAAILRDYLGYDCRVESFVGQWLPVGMDSQTRIGGNRQGQHNRLGDGVLIGNRVWDLQSKIRIHIGPMELAEYEALLPGTDRHKAMCRLIQGYLPSHMNIELRFTIHAGEASRRLGRGVRCARTTWLRSDPDRPMEARFELKPAVA